QLARKWRWQFPRPSATTERASTLSRSRQGEAFARARPVQGGLAGVKDPTQNMNPNIVIGAPPSIFLIVGCYVAFRYVEAVCRLDSLQGTAQKAVVAILAMILLLGTLLSLIEPLLRWLTQ